VVGSEEKLLRLHGDKLH